MFFYLLFVPALFLEGSVTTLPLVFDLLMVFYIHKREDSLFGLAVLSGILLDSMLARQLGVSSLFFIVSLFIVGLYERKFETKGLAFVFLSSLVLGFLYLFLVNSFFSIGLSFLNALLTTGMYWLLGNIRTQ